MKLTSPQCILPAFAAQLINAAITGQSSTGGLREITTDNAAAAPSLTAAKFFANEAHSHYESNNDVITRFLKADSGIATYNEKLGIPKCSSEGSSCDTGDLIIGRGKVHPEPNHPNTLNSNNCFDGTSGGPSDESVDRIVISSESGGYLMEERDARITATVNCYADGYTNDYIYFYYSTLHKNADDYDWNFIERVQCTGGGQQNFSTSYTLPRGSDHAVRVSIRHLENDDVSSDEDSCGLGSFTDNDDVAFTVSEATLEEETVQPTPSLPDSFTSSPSVSPSTTVPTRTQTLSPTDSPFVLFSYGESLYTDHELGIQISDGLSAKLIAQAGEKVTLAKGDQSNHKYHLYMDGAGITPLSDGGYVYVSNSEDDARKGGVHGLYFNEDGEITNYKPLLTGTTWNCGGGVSPWNTWISCEEHDRGQCWQVDPDPSSAKHNSPEVTLLGGSGGNYESVAVDNTNEDKPVFFTTEDNSWGELRRFEADGNDWDSLHEGGQTTYLQFLDGNKFKWTTSLEDGQNSAANHYPNSEGIAYHNSTLYFVSKVTQRLYILDLNDKTYTSERTGSSWVGQGSFNSQPDQIIGNDMDKRKYIYFTEDGGNAPGVHVRDRDGKYYTMVRAIPKGRYRYDETVGIAFSPNRTKFYFGFQDAGVLMEVTRDDGREFN